MATLQCTACHKLEDPDEGELLEICDRCKLVKYCTASCQRDHWPNHKKNCKKLSKSSVPERLLAMDENIDKSYANSTANVITIYPYLYAVWLGWKYNTSSSAN
jgi:hypothetical protein